MSYGGVFLVQDYMTRANTNTKKCIKHQSFRKTWKGLFYHCICILCQSFSSVFLVLIPYMTRADTHWRKTMVLIMLQLHFCLYLKMYGENCKANIWGTFSCGFIKSLVGVLLILVICGRYMTEPPSLRGGSTKNKKQEIREMIIIYL